MKKKVVTCKPKSDIVHIDQCSTYLGLECDSYKTKYLILGSYGNGDKINTLKQGSSILSSSSFVNLKDFIEYYISIQFTVYSFDSQKELMEWFTK